MAALNILSPPLNPLQLTTDSTSLSICKYNININSICQKYASASNSICKCGRTLATAKSKLSFMPSQMFPQRQHLSGDIWNSFRLSWGLNFGCFYFDYSVFFQFQYYFLISLELQFWLLNFDCCLSSLILWVYYFLFYFIFIL